MSLKFNSGGMGKEPFWKSRRIWGAILSGTAVTITLLQPEHFTLIVMGASCIATALGLTSFIKPKQI